MIGLLQVAYSLTRGNVSRHLFRFAVGGAIARAVSARASVMANNSQGFDPGGLDYKQVGRKHALVA